ncbi:MAG TPA: GNAT family N-acetyltransferase [Myxococcota bacterium]
MTTRLRRATVDDEAAIWAILRDAIERRRRDGSRQWQDGYPNPAVVAADVARGVGFVLVDADDVVVGYVACIVDDEPAYAQIDGAWLGGGSFLVFHRVAVASTQLGRGLAAALLAHVEQLARDVDVDSVRADTNFDNGAMLHLFAKCGYAYCGEISLRGSPRRAYEKRLR